MLSQSLTALLLLLLVAVVAAWVGVRLRKLGIRPLRRLLALATDLPDGRIVNVAIGASLGHLDWTTNAIPTNVTSFAFHPLSPEDATNPDRDGDGLSLLDELFAFGTDPDLADTDRDGLADSEELAAGTDPLDPHSIRPDVCDGYALAMGGLDPLAVPEGSTNTVLERRPCFGT